MRNQMDQKKEWILKIIGRQFIFRFMKNFHTARLLAGSCFFLGLLLGAQISWAASAPAVRIINAKVDAADHFVFTFDCLSGESYEVQVSTNLSAWTSLVTLSGTQSNVTWRDFDPLQDRRFYRVNSIQTSPTNLATNDILTVTQTWSEETNYVRTALVSAPPGDGPYPVVILLHGALGTATNFIGQFEYLSQMIRVAPQGYSNLWNVNSEDTLAPDVDFIRELISQLRTYNNVDAGNIIILGWSNGAALLNRLLIELNGALFQQGIKLAGQMNEIQFHDSAFWYDPTGGNAYDTQIQPARGRRILSIVGTADVVVPFAGGDSDYLPYYFLHAGDSIHEWAKQMGSTEVQIPDEDGVLVDTDTYEYSYLNGDVMMYKIVGSDHRLNTFSEPYDDRTKNIIKAFLNLPD